MDRTTATIEMISSPAYPRGVAQATTQRANEAAKTEKNSVTQCQTSIPPHFQTLSPSPSPKAPFHWNPRMFTYLEAWVHSMPWPCSCQARGISTCCTRISRIPVPENSARPAQSGRVQQSETRCVFSLLSSLSTLPPDADSPLAVDRDRRV